MWTVIASCPNCTAQHVKGQLLLRDPAAVNGKATKRLECNEVASLTLILTHALILTLDQP